MNLTSIGDLAQSLMLKQRSVGIRQSIATLSDELATGRVSNVTERLAGDFSYLSDIDRNLSRLKSFSLAAGEAAYFSSAAQTSLESIQNETVNLSGSLLSANPSNLEAVRGQLAGQAVDALQAVLMTLNTTAGGRSLFAGTATDRSPLAGVEVMLGELKPLVSGLGSASSVQAAVQGWFADPAGFQAIMYAGSDQDLAPIQVGPGREIALTLRADDPVFRDVLQNIALAALAGDASLAFAPEIQNNLFRLAGDGILSGQDKLVGLRSDLGFAEARIEEASVRNSSAKTGLEFAKMALLEADPFETATRLEEAQFQLESLYAVTVRSSNLSLLNFLR